MKMVHKRGDCVVRKGLNSVYTYCDDVLVVKIKEEASKCGLSVSSWIRQVIIKEITKGDNYEHRRKI